MDRNLDVRLLARALARAGLSGAYGHCSIRIAQEPTTFLVSPAKPMGLVEAGEPGSIVPVSGPLPPGVLGEVRMHQHVYRLRPDVNAICRFISPNVNALAALGRTPLPRYGFGSYFHPAVPRWPDPELVRTNEAASGVAELLGSGPAVIIGVNGALVAGETPEQALTLAWNLEDAARVELVVLAAGMESTAPLLTKAQAEARATWQGAVAERMWDHLTAGDPERPQGSVAWIDRT